jgi:kynurenine formamidase
MNARRRPRRLIEKLQRAREIVIGIRRESVAIPAPAFVAASTALARVCLRSLCLGGPRWDPHRCPVPFLELRPPPRRAGRRPLQSYAAGLGRFSVDTLPPILRRGVLLDVAGLYGGVLPEDFEIAPEHLETAARAHGVEIRAGDVALLRTGWAAFWDDPTRFIRQVRGPGPALAGARWLSERGVFAAGSDTVAFEKVPDASMPVHVHLLVEKGIHIVECLNLEELARAGVHEFLFIAAPLKIRGATASPIRPIAVA